MAGADKPSQKLDKACEGDSKVATSGKVATESVTDEAQAQRYGQNFTSFSSNNDKFALIEGDPLRQLMAQAGVHGQAEWAGRAVSEFIIEDKQADKAITACGERELYEPGKSWMDGLQRIIGEAQSPEEFAARQLKLCMEYIERKIQELAAMAQGAGHSMVQRQESSTMTGSKQACQSDVTAEAPTTPGILASSMSTIGPAHLQDGSSIHSRNVEQPQNVPFVAPALDVPRDVDTAGQLDGSLVIAESDNAEHASADALLIANNPQENATRFESSEQRKVSKASNNIDFSGKSPYSTAPDSVFIISAEGVPCTLLGPNRWLLFAGEYLPFSQVLPIIQSLDSRQFYPEGRRLIQVNACDSAYAANAEASAAARLARFSNSWTLGAVGSVNTDTNEAYIKPNLFAKEVPGKWALFDPRGVPRMEFPSVMTQADWESARTFINRSSDPFAKRSSDAD
jgi:hypothetical protein